MRDAPSVDLLDAFENAFPDTAFVLTEDGEILRTFAGPEIDVLLIEDFENAVGASVEDVFLERPARKLREQIEKTLDTQSLQTREYVIETEVGSHSFEARMAPVESDKVQPLVVAIFRDITARDLYAQRLDETNRVVNTIQESTQAVSRAQSIPELYESICDVITTATPYQFAWIGRYDEEANKIVPTAVAAGGQKYVETLELAVTDSESESQRPPAVEAITEEDTTIVQSVYTSTSNGQWQSNALDEGFHSVAAFPIFQDGDIEAVLSVYAPRPYAFGFNERALFEELCRDIALAEQALATRSMVEQQKAELEARNFEWEVLNRIVRHDIRNKMAVIMGYVELLTDSATGKERDQLQKALESSKQVIEITKEARDVAEALVNAGDIDLQDVAIGTTLQTELDEIEHAYPDATVTVDGNLSNETVRANDFLSSVFRNVLANAIIHNDAAEPRITVTMNVTDDTVIVDIADNGPGIPEHVQEAVLDIDQPIGGVNTTAADDEDTDATSAGSASEHGVGLRLVCSLVDQYGGEIRFTENTPNGTVVSIELQRA